MSTTEAITLRALVESKVPGINKSTTFRIDPDLIEFEEGFNLRTENDELGFHIDRLYEAMKAGAFIPPVDVTVREGKVIARDGHCRIRAARRVKADLPEYTLECRQLRGNESDAVLHMLGTGSGSKPLTPLEQGIGYLRLIKMGMTSPQIAGKLGISRVTVDNGLTLAEAPMEVQNMVSNGEVSATLAREALKGGTEGVAALRTAVEIERKTPSPKKKSGKKAKVTAKKLKKVEKKEKPLAFALGAGGKPKANTSTAQPDDTQISVTIDKEVAKHTAEFLRTYGMDDDKLNTLASIFETALM